ncbi:hypothetical protein tb265_24980 [Gemmatimonadetes bacterium T265]|nr:hypothetical protein tb265_24980 [Gemmatimonadetes bacterium T265]
MLPERAAADFAGVAAALLVAATLLDAFEVMLLPRRVRRRLRFVRTYFRGTWRLWAAASPRFPERVRATFLSLYGPLAMIGLFAAWTAALIAGFGVLQWAVARDEPVLGGFGAHAPSLVNQLYFSGVTFFTLGYGDVTAHTRLGRFLSVLEAGIGFGLLAVVIGYLPVLYQLFSRREAHVIRLDARAGSPPTAAELIARHAVSAQGLESLAAFLGEWEQWAAELLESHLSYPMLGYYRSQHDNESWLAALTTVLDACALLTLGLTDLAAGDGDAPRAGPSGADAPGARRGVAERLPTFQARMTFATARLAVVEMARALHNPSSGEEAREQAANLGARPGTAAALDDALLHDAAALPAAALRPEPADAHADRLPPIAVARLRARLAEVGLTFAERDEETGIHLHTLRQAYEPFVEALALRLLLPLPRWVAYDDATDNWQQSVGGVEAKRAFEAAEDAEADAEADAQADAQAAPGPDGADAGAAGR